MSASQKSDLDLELEFLPAWARQSEESQQKKYEKFRGDEESGFRGKGKGRRDQRGPRRDGGPRGRGRDDKRGDRRNDDRGRGPKGRGRDDKRGGRDDRGRGRDDRRGGRDNRRDRRPERPTVPVPEVLVSIVPEPTGLDAIARQIKLTGRAYPVFDIARLIVKAADRFQVEFRIKETKEGIAQKLYSCDLDNTLWLNQAEAGRHALSRFFDTFYETEKIPTDPPKGTYTFVAQCGMSGVILGPPNYHDYQQKLVKLHQDRFSKMPFDKFKSRVKIVREEEVVKQWVDEQSFKTEFTALNVPETVKFNSRDEVQAHFESTHQANVIKEVQSHRMSSKDAGNSGAPDLRRLFRNVFEDQRRFPLKVVNILCEEFAKHGLQFFKKDKTVTHVAVSRPHFLDVVVTPVSDSIKGIIQFINDTPECTRRKIFDALAPVKTIEVPPPAPIEEPKTEPTTDSAKNDEAEAANPAESADSTNTEESPADKTAKPADDSEPEMPPEQQAVNADLHWLIHQGHVIEFSNGVVETAKKPRQTPPQQGSGKKKKKKGKKAAIFPPDMSGLLA